MTIRRPIHDWLLTALVVLFVCSSASAGWKEKVLYSFQGASDGYEPAGGVVFDKAGNLYGVNSWGGSGGCLDPGCGTVFELSPPSQKGGAWTETTIYAFQGVLGSVKDGFTPAGSVIIDQAGNLYGTTSLGGNGPCILLGSATGCGIVYKLSPPKQKDGQWTETILHNFQSGTDGYFPWGDLVFDKNGNLYGSTQFGGGKGTTCNQFYGGTCGTVFKLRPPSQKDGKWTEKVLHSFAGVVKGQKSGDGANPNGGLVLDNNGAVYGAAQFGGFQKGVCDPGGCGMTFELVPPNDQHREWARKILYRFRGLGGGEPTASVVFGGSNLYGTTYGGGRDGYGVVFELNPSSGGALPWKENVLHRFRNRGDGIYPKNGVFRNLDGSLWGTTAGVHGVVFRMKPSTKKGEEWTFAVVYTFAGSPDGASPNGNLVIRNGNIFSTTLYGGTGQSCQGGCGTVFQVLP